jgi:hypothetical protein
MDASALDISITSLESSSDSLSCWLTVFTVLVVIGLIVEYWHDAVELLKKRPIEKKLVHTIVGGTLITLGVAGELAVQYAAAGIEAKLRAVNHRVEAALLNAASDSNARAKGFERDIASANSAASLANERAGALEKEAADLRVKAVDAETALLKLRQRIQSRHLTPAQRKAITEHLSDKPGGRIGITCAGGRGSESCDFSEGFKEALMAAGWRVDSASSRLPHGVTIVRRSPKPLPREAPLRAALEAAGFTVNVEQGENALDWIELLIGDKPPEAAAPAAKPKTNTP